MQETNPEKVEWLQINFKLINEDLFDIYTEESKGQSNIDAMDGVQLSTINQSIKAFVDRKDLELMTEMIRYKFEGMLEHEEGNEPGEFVQITVRSPKNQSLTGISCVVVFTQVSH
jgi:hypothetical protein